MYFQIKSISQKVVPILPGLSISIAVSVISRLLALFVPQLGSAIIAILLGILLGNTFFRQKSLSAGTKFSESKLLEISVVLLGATVTFQTITQIGIKGILFILMQMFITITGAYFIGKKMRFNDTFSLMMAGGNAVCGSSAIASIAPSIHADDKEKGQVITLVNLLGTVMMLTLPFLGEALYGKNILQNSALLGGTLQSVGQVVAGASMLNQEVVQYSMLFKISRIVLLVVVVFVFKKLIQRNSSVTAVQSEKKKIPLPWYILGFLIFCIFNSTMELPNFFEQTAHFISNWLEITALAAIGLRLDFSKFIKEGPRFLLYGLSVGGLQTIVAVFLIFCQL